ncbi:hypothetical protein FV217_19610 [Methylobacterium sp. WL9]|nr:hypothetical protein [Methylobacterium sp. WL9]TXN19963.1 hypothetical protein FV217_19610 [Methylobacterium sp. WL9]
MPPNRPDIPCLTAYPYVVVRVACDLCPRRTGSYRLARLAAKYGPETPLDRVLAWIAFDCPWRDSWANDYVPRCHAHFSDIGRPAPRPPDLPGLMEQMHKA